MLFKDSSRGKRCPTWTAPAAAVKRDRVFTQARTYTHMSTHIKTERTHIHALAYTHTSEERSKARSLTMTDTNNKKEKNDAF